MNFFHVVKRDITGRFGLPYGISRQQEASAYEHAHGALAGVPVGVRQSLVIKLPLLTWRRLGYHREFDEFEYGWWDYRIFVRIGRAQESPTRRLVTWDFDWILRRSLGPRLRGRWGAPTCS